MTAVLIFALVACVYLPTAMLVGHRLRRIHTSYPIPDALASRASLTGAASPGSPRCAYKPGQDTSGWAGVMAAAGQ